MTLAVTLAVVAAFLVGVAAGVAIRRRTGPDVAPGNVAGPLPASASESSAASTSVATARSVEVSPAGGSAVDHRVGQVLRDAVDELDLGVVVADAGGRMVYRNAASSVFGGTHVGVIVDEHLTSILGETRDGESAHRLVELQGPPKSWLEIDAEPVPSGGAVATMQDVSERMRIDAMRTDFITNISHELKTPVGAVAVLAEALIDEPDHDVVNRLADHIVDESHRAVRTIDDLLKLSQIESTKPGDSVVDLTAVVATAIGRGRAVDGGRGVQISSIDPARPVLVRGDERQLVSAIGNLVENAVKYSHAGDVVQVRTRTDDSVVEVMIADQGVGIPARDLDRVFERFYRVDKARSRETGGTGLGLAIVRHVATNHGGEVLVQSQEGEGSTFVLRLPASLLVSEPPEPPEPLVDAAGIEPERSEEESIDE